MADRAAHLGTRETGRCSPDIPHGRAPQGGSNACRTDRRLASSGPGQDLNLAAFGRSRTSVVDMVANDGRASSPTTPRVFLSWSHMSDRARVADDSQERARADAEWRDLVFSFVVALRERGIDADVDLAHMHDIDTDWTRYGPRALAAADVVLVIVNEAWREAWDESGDGARGRGAAAEADVIRSLFGRGRDAFQGSLVLVMLPGAAATAPIGLDRLQRVRVPTFDDAGMSTLLRLLTAQPEFTLPPLGRPPVLPPRVLPSPPPQPSTATQGTEPSDAPTSVAGEGDAVVDLQAPTGAVSVLVKAEGNEPRRHFAVRPLGAGPALINTTEDYRGTTLLPLPDNSSVVRFEIKAVGPWKAELLLVERAPTLLHGSATTGSGDTVLQYAGPGGIARITGNPNRRHFAVQAVRDGQGRGRSIVNTTDDYAGSVSCPAGPLLLVIRAQGPWEIEVT